MRPRLLSLLAAAHCSHALQPPPFRTRPRLLPPRSFRYAPTFLESTTDGAERTEVAELPDALLVEVVSADLPPAERPVLSLSPAEEEEEDAELSEASSLLLLNFVALIWGTQHAVIKMVVDDSVGTAASDFSLARFLVAALCVLPYTPSLRGLLPGSPSPASRTWRRGLELGSLMFAGYAAQAVGLASTTAQRSGFLLYLNVKLVPILAFLTLGRRISAPTWLSALAALAGTFLLSYDGGAPPNAGDAWSIAAAAFSAGFILQMEAAAREVKDGAGLNAACLWTVAALSLLWTTGGHLSDLPTEAGAPLAEAAAAVGRDVAAVVERHPVEILYLGGVSTAAANWIQTKGQRGVTAERASIVYAMDPVYGAGFAYLLLGETMGFRGAVGAAIIATAAATNAFLDLGAKDDTED